EAKDVPWLQCALADEDLPVQARPECAPEVADENTARLDAQLCVPFRHPRVVEGVVEDHLITADEKPLPGNAAPLRSAVRVIGESQHDRWFDRRAVRRHDLRRAGCITHCSAPRVRSGRLLFRVDGGGRVLKYT